MPDLNDLLVRIDATTEVLRRELRRAESSTGRTAGRMDRSLQKIDKRFDVIARRAAAAGTAFVAFATGAGAAKLVQIARETDILNAQLKTATGSSEAAEQAFAWLEDFGARTPFQLQEVVNAFVKLKNLGLNPSQDALESYGNTASAMGKSLDQFIEAVADAATAEFERLKEFGIRAKNQGDTIAFTFRGITTTVANNAADIERFLKRIGEVEFAGAMQERVNSLDGALSNLQDSWDALFRTIAGGGVGDAIENQVRVSIIALEKLERKIALLQGTASPEDQLIQQRHDLFERLQSLERELANAPVLTPFAGPEYYENLNRLIDETKQRIQGTQQAIEFFRKSVIDRFPGRIIEEIDTSTIPNRRAVPIPERRKARTGGGLSREAVEFIETFEDEDAEAKRFFQNTRTEAEQLEAQIARVQELAAKGFFNGVDDQQILERLDAQLQEVLSKTDETTREIADALALNVGGAIDEMFSSGKLSAEDFAESVLRDLARIATQLFIMKPLIESLFGAGGGSGAFGKAVFEAFGFAKGADFTVGGSGAPDSKFFPMALSPGEHVKITPRGRQTLDTVVNVIDQRGAQSPPMSASEQVVGMQRVVSVLVRGELAGAFADGSIDKLFSASTMPVKRRGSR